MRRGPGPESAATNIRIFRISPDQTDPSSACAIGKAAAGSLRDVVAGRNDEAEGGPKMH